MGGALLLQGNREYCPNEKIMEKRRQIFGVTTDHKLSFRKHCQKMGRQAIAARIKVTTLIRKKQFGKTTQDVALQNSDQ